MAVTNQMVAPRYAKALLEAAHDQNQVETVHEEAEVNKIFKSVLKAEERRRAVG